MKIYMCVWILSGNVFANALTHIWARVCQFAAFSWHRHVACDGMQRIAAECCGARFECEWASGWSRVEYSKLLSQPQPQAKVPTTTAHHAQNHAHTLYNSRTTPCGECVSRSTFHHPHDLHACANMLCTCWWPPSMHLRMACWLLLRFLGKSVVAIFNINYCNTQFFLTWSIISNGSNIHCSVCGENGDYNLEMNQAYLNLWNWCPS